MTLNGEMALILPYFIEFGSGPYFALFSTVNTAKPRLAWLTILIFICQNMVAENKRRKNFTKIN